jgi:hypothetical protein
MTEQEIRQSMHDILDAHADALAAIRSAHTAMQAAFAGHDAALVSAINANQAALRMLNRIMDEGIAGP